MRCFKLAGFVIALLAGLAVAGFAQPRFGGPPPGGGPGTFGGPPAGRGPDRFIEEHAEQLGLDDETLEAIDQIVDESREKARALHADRPDVAHGLRARHPHPLVDETQDVSRIQADLVAARRAFGDPP